MPLQSQAQTCISHRLTTPALSGRRAANRSSATPENINLDAAYTSEQTYTLTLDLLDT